MKTSNAGMLIASVAVKSYVVSDIRFASTAEGFNREYLAFLHSLGGLGLDEGDLSAAMYFLAQDITLWPVSFGIALTGMIFRSSSTS